MTHPILPILVIAMAAPTGSLFGQAPNSSAVPNPVFEVATIKPSNPAAQGKSGGMRGSQFYASNVTLNYMISFAYGVHPGQITGGPGWLDADKFDVVATPNTSASPTLEQLRIMMRELLSERFALSFHNGRKLLDVYTVTAGGRPLKLSPSTRLPEELPKITFNYGTISAANATIKDFVGTLQSNVLDRPVLDNTGISGRFDFALNWSPDEFQYGGRGANGQAGTGPTIFTAIQEQLGLELRSAKAQSEVMIIDRVDRPTEN